MERMITHSSPPKRVSKRSSNACARCRKQKIKCSGLQPCEGCRKRKVACNFDDKDDKVVVTRAYLLDLQRKVATRSPSSPDHPPHTGGNARSTIATPSISGHEDDTLLEEGRDADTSRNNDLDTASRSDGREERPSDLTNPLVASPSTFMSTSNGKPFYLGTSSNWSFSGRLLQMTHEFLHKTPLPTDAVLFDGSAYDFGWRGDFISDEADIPAIPSPDYAIYLINAVKFHCGQLFHLFDDEEFHRNLQRFYSNPTQKEKKSDLWYIHFLLILAFGKMFILQKVTGTRPSGSEFFQRAMEILPPTYILCQQPIAATEILCCIALYLQCFDHRQAAYIYISQAMRTAMGYGMHTEMPVAQLGEEYVQRCRKIWWTIYLLDRQMTSLMGLPQCMQDTDIQCQVPVYPEASQRTTTLEMHIKLAGVIARISNSIYGADGRLNRKFLVSTKALLESLAGLAVELGQVVPLKLDNPGYGVPRMSASLHLLYHQCIVLATRPLIFCCLKMCLEGATNSKEPTRHRLASIVQMCMESAQQTIIILESLQAQGLLETFLPMDLDALYVSSVILAIAPVIDDSRLKDHASWTHRSLTLLDTIISAGNLIATWRRSEVQQLDQNMEQILAVGLRIPCSSTTVTVADVQLQETSHTETLPFDQSSLQSQALNMMETGTGEDLTADQIMAIANSIQDEDVEWMERAIAENSIW